MFARYRAVSITKTAVLGLLIVIFAGAGELRASAQPLSQDDVVLLLIGGATPQKMVSLIEQRGVDFQMTPNLEKKFRNEGAGDAIISALKKASEKPAANSSRSIKTPPDNPPSRGNPVSGRSAATPAASGQSGSTSGAAAASASSSAAVDNKVNETLAALSSPPPQQENSDSDAAPALKTRSTTPKAAPDLRDPSPAQIQNIIQEFAAKETLFKEARDNYTYHQINKVETIDPDGNVDGVFRQDWDILFDDSGKRIEQVTYAPENTLKGILVTEQDLDAMRNIQPFVLTADELPEYDIKYLGHVKVDELTAYVFSIRPKEIKKGKQYFQGVVWVDDRDLQIVKSEGKNVPEIRSKGNENLFPRFTTYREQIDGKFWFPTFTMADDTLEFSSGPVHIKEIIRYTNYKQFRSTTKIKVLSDAPNPSPNPKTPTPNRN